MNLRNFVCLIVSICSIGYAHSQTGGNVDYASLSIPANARVAALGGNLISVYDNDVNLGLSNPSLLNETMHGKVGFNYVNYFSSINLAQVSSAYTIDSTLTLQAGLRFMDYGKITRTDVGGNNLGTFNANDFVFTLGAGYVVDSLFSIGANVKTIYAGIDGLSSFAIATDLAGTYRKESKKFVATVVLKNIGVNLSSYTETSEETLPFEIQLGISKELKHAPFRFSVIAENLQKWDLTYDDPTIVTLIDPISGEVVNDQRWEFGDKFMRHIVFGTELLISDNFQIRVGYNYRRRQELKLNDRPGTAGFSFGAGLQIKRFHINYGRAIYHQAGPSNNITITTQVF